MESSHHYLLVGKKDCVLAWDWDKLSEGDGDTSPSWDIPLQGEWVVLAFGELSSIYLSCQGGAR